MAARKTSNRETVPSGVATARAFGVVLERIESQMAVVLEAVTSSSQRLDAKLDAVEARLSERISWLENVVRRSSADTNAVREEVARLRQDFDLREGRARIDALEARVAVLEGRLGAA
jgi:hypothetical protein